MKYKIYNQDVLDWAKEYNKGKFHALLCDPPYHLQSPSSKSGSQPEIESPFGRHNQGNGKKGFMGQTWDGGDVAFRPETWAALGEHLYDGAFGMAFSASRNWHRLAVAIEDAGFVIHPTIFGWLNGQGFPKATNISKQIQPASKQRKVGKYKLPNGQEWNLKQAEDDSVEHVGGTFTGSKTRTLDILEPTDEMAARWTGHRYGLQALKPAIEPIIVFQKPYRSKPIDDIVSTGAGALNIDAGRIPTQDTLHSGATKGGGEYDGWNFKLGTSEQSPLGRWPSNFLLDDVTAPLLDAQTGTLTSGIPSGKKHAENNIYGQYKNDDVDVTGFGDSGGASRFFYNVSNQIDEADPIYYCAKVSKKERNAGLDDLPDKIFAQSGGAQASVNRGEDEYKQDSIGINRVTQRKNIHPTVKPIDLATYLAKLLLPPDEYAPRRILVPFSGVGSEMIGCAKAGWEQIVGIEFDTENGYIEIAEKRIEYWTKK